MEERFSTTGAVLGTRMADNTLSLTLSAPGATRSAAITCSGWSPRSGEAGGRPLLTGADGTFSAGLN
jgi:hypothetical protein